MKKTGFNVIIGLTLTMFFLTVVSGKLSQKTFIGILFYLIIGAIYPPFGIGFGAVIVLHLLLVNSQPVLKWILSKVGKKQ